MLAGAVNAKYGGEPGADLVCRNPAHPDALVACGRARFEREVPTPDAERGGEDAEDLAVGGAIGRRGRDPHAECVTPEAGHPRA